MFTGIIEEIGTIRAIDSMGAQQLELKINCREIQSDLKLGDSVAVDGVCLTVTHFNDTGVSFELSSETYKASLFPHKRKDMKVNLERALRLGDRLGGHLVQGHIDSLSKMLQINKMGDFFELDFSLDPKVKKYIVHKGSITINGISLTVSRLREKDFRVAIIPHTYQQTSLSELSVADGVHIETDVIARYIERLLPFQKDQADSGLTLEFMKEHGF